MFSSVITSKVVSERQFSRVAMLRVFMLVCLVTSAWGEVERVESRIVKIKQGSVRGYKAPDDNFFVFHSIPYATAPTGSQRFKEPLPPPVWTNIYEAVNRGIVCPQFDYFGLVLNEDIEAKEDCLHANIYVPDTKEQKLPVLVYVHGGGYLVGFAELVKPKQLANTKKAIIVNFNYRLGPHGFLCLGTKDIPGNAGMKDMVALLRWVKDNIASFGGNPDDVTVAGYSAGSSAVDLLQLSKMADNLFNKVIPESGANTAAFSVQADPLANAKSVAKKLKFNNVDDIDALEEFYKTASYELLTSVNLMEELDSTFIFSPCVERDTGVEMFLNDSPVNILKSGKYQKRPMLYGFANMEGLFRINHYEQWKDKMNAKLSDFLPADLHFENESEKEKIAIKIKKFYFGGKPVGNENILGFVDFFSDVVFAYPTLRSVRLQVEAGNDQIYLYEYAYTDDDTPEIPYTNVRGANHCAQTMVVHDGLNITHIDESILSDSMKNMKKMLREMWLNFVTTGKPVPEGSSLPAWLPTGANGSPYMILTSKPELMNVPMLSKRVQFWDKIYDQYYRHPSPPNPSPSKHTEL